MSEFQLRFIPLVPTFSKNEETDPPTTPSKGISSSQLSGGSYDTVELSSNSEPASDSPTTDVLTANINASLYTNGLTDNSLNNYINFNDSGNYNNSYYNGYNPYYNGYNPYYNNNNAYYNYNNDYYNSNSNSYNYNTDYNNSNSAYSSMFNNALNTVQDTSKLGTDIFNVKDSALNVVGNVAGQDVKTVLQGGLGALTLADPTGIISGSINLADSFTDAYRDNDTVGGIAGDTVANFGDNLAQNIREVGNGANTIFSDIGLGGVGSAVSGIADTIAGGVSGVGHAIGGAIEWAADGISDFFGFGGGSDSGSSSSASSSFSSSSSTSSGGGGGGGGSLWRTILSWF